MSPLRGYNGFGYLGSTPSYASFYRETKVTEAEFDEAFNQTLTDYNILESDYGTWKSSETGGTASTGCMGTDYMKNHLESAFVWPYEDKEAAAKAQGCE